jgi:hypothetical protein
MTARAVAANRWSPPDSSASIDRVRGCEGYWIWPTPGVCGRGCDVEVVTASLRRRKRAGRDAASCLQQPGVSANAGLVAERLGRVRAAKGARAFAARRGLEEQPCGRLEQRAGSRTGRSRTCVAQAGVSIRLPDAARCFAPARGGVLRMAPIAMIAMLRAGVTGLSTEVHRPFRKLAVRRGLVVC